MVHQSPSDRLFGFLVTALLGVISLAVLYPLFFVLIASVSDANDVINGKIWLWPKGWNLEGYKLILQNGEMLAGYANTLLYTVVGTAVNITMTVMAAYPLSRKPLFGRHALTFVLVFTMFFSGGLIPTYLLVKHLGMLNSIWAMVIPSAVSVWNVIIMRTFFQTSIPPELQESAEIDGATELQTLRKVVLPLSLPILAVMVLFYGVSHWNSYFTALIYLTDRSKYPLQLFLRELLVQNTMTDGVSSVTKDFIEQMKKAESAKYAAVLIANVPVLVLYPILQKYFAKGLMVGAIKG